MNVTDPIADMLTRIRNASLARHRELTLPSSRIKRDIARILVSMSAIGSVEFMSLLYLLGGGSLATSGVGACR